MNSSTKKKFREEKLRLSIRWCCFHQMMFFHQILLILFCSLFTSLISTKWNICRKDWIVDMICALSEHELKQTCFPQNKIHTNMFSTKQNTIKAKIARQTFARNVAFTQILDLLNILLFQNTVDFVCLVIQRYSSKEKMRHSITQHCFNQMLLPFSKRFIQQPYWKHICQVVDFVGVDKEDLILVFADQ